MIFIYIIFTIIGLLSYNKHKERYLSILYLVSTSFLGFIPLGLRGHDFGLIMMLYALFKNSFIWKNDRIAKSLIILTLYVVVRTIVTIILGEESLANAIGLLRCESFVLGYFVLKQMPLKVLSRFLELLLFITIPLCISQLIAISIWGRYDNVILTERNLFISQLTQLPSTIVLCIGYYFFKDEKDTKDWIKMSILFMSLICSNVRGLLIAVIISIGIFVIKKGHLKNAVIILLLLLPTSTVVFSDNNQKGNPLTELSVVWEKIKSKNYNSFDYKEGNLEFRMVLALERIDYMCSDLSLMTFGYGVVKERSPNNKLQFMIGSGNIDENGMYYRQTIETADVAFITHFIRYGVVYIILFLLLIVSIIKMCNKSKSYYGMCATFIIYVYLIASPTNDYVSSLEDWMPIFLLLVMSELSRKESFNNSIVKL